jgi:hypothetical protein
LIPWLEGGSRNVFDGKRTGEVGSSDRCVSFVKRGGCERRRGEGEEEKKAEKEDKGEEEEEGIQERIKKKRSESFRG